MAIDVNLLILSGQSNAGGVNDGTDTYPDVITGDAWEYRNLTGSEIIDFSLSNIGEKTTILPSFIATNKELNGKTYIVYKNATGGSWLLSGGTPGLPNWSSSGTLRQPLVDDINTAIAFINNDIRFNLGEILFIWKQGEADAGDAFLGTSGFTTEGYKNGLIEFFDFIEAETGIEKYYISSVGDTVAGTQTAGYDIIRAGEVACADERANTTFYNDRTASYSAFGWHYDDVHHNQLGLNDDGKVLAETINGALLPIYRDEVYTEVLEIPDITSYYKFNDNKSTVLSGGDVTYLNSATTESSFIIDREDCLLGTQDTNKDSWAEVANVRNPQAWSVSGYMKLPSNWPVVTAAAIGDRQLIGDNSTNGGMNLKVGGVFEVEFYENGSSSSTRIISTVAPSSKKDVNLPFVITYNDLTSTAKLYLDGSLEASGVVATSKSPYESLMIGNGFLFGNGLDPQQAPTLGIKFDMIRTFNRVINTTEVSNLSNEYIPYNSINTPVTPDAPIITEENNDTNTFAWTAVNDVEMQLKGGGWNDATSPYDVGYNDYAIGEIEIRVKAEGINPVSGVASNTIAFTARDQEDKSTITVYSRDLTGADDTAVQVRLINDAVQYKTNVILQNDTVTYTPDADGLITMDLIETDNMEGTQYYLISFGEQNYKFQVPNQSSAIFWDLGPVKTKITM